MSKARFVLMALVGLNVVLAGAMVVLSYDLPPVYAQRSGGSGKYLAATALYTGGADALFIVQTRKARMVVLAPMHQTGEVEVVDLSDVNADLGLPSK